MYAVTRSGPEAGSAAEPITYMMQSAHAVADQAAHTDYNAPRSIQRSTSVFLLSRAGELWRVTDTDRPGSVRTTVPSSTSSLPYRVFSALTRAEDVRVYTFPRLGARGIDAATMQRQLDESNELAPRFTVGGR